MKDAINVACRIYQGRAASVIRPQESLELLQQLRHKVHGISHETEGSHALVWTYFVGAAESESLEDREFFAKRLLALYSRTQFRSIPAALKNLENIWFTNASMRWTEALTQGNQILIM